MTIYEYPGAIDPETYELENLTADPYQMIEAHMNRIAPMDGVVVMDIGAGSGFHAARFARNAKYVYAVEPDLNMHEQFRTRFTGTDCLNVTLLAADAEQIPLPDESIDIAHARFAYFFGALGDCRPGINEVKRLLNLDGHFFIIDNCYNRGQFAEFLRMAYGQGEELQSRNDEFYRNLGFDVTIIDSCWRAPSRDALKQVLTMEFPEKYIEAIMSTIPGIEFSYAYSVYHYHKQAQEK